MANAELLCVAIDDHVIFSHYLLMGAAAQRRASVDIRRRRAAPASCSFISLPPSSGLEDISWDKFFAKFPIAGLRVRPIDDQ